MSSEPLPPEPALSVGQRLRSQVCATEVIVVRAPHGAVALACGGAPMIASSEAPDPGVAAGGVLAGFEGSTLIGKRYTDSAGSLELLATKAGAGALAMDGAPLTVKTAKALPSSD